MLILPRACLTQISAYAEAEYPGEACGFLLGDSNGGAKTVQSVLPISNAARQNLTRFVIAPKGGYEAEKAARQKNQSVVGVFHSHPDAAACPSAADRAAAWAGLSYLIVCVQNGRVADYFSWVLVSENAGAMQKEMLCLE